MKKAFPYIIIVIVIAAIAVLLIGNRGRIVRELNERITLRKKDKIPYGCYVAFENLKYIFPDASIYVNRNQPKNWDSISEYEPNQALLIITPQFLADKDEMKKIIVFAQSGNDVFISSRRFPSYITDMLNCSSYAQLDFITITDSLTLKLIKPPFTKATATVYPGKAFDAYLYNYDTAITYILGTNEQNEPDFIRLMTGKGNIYIHLAPLAFSNYFLLHHNNIGYYDNVLSVIPGSVKKVIWDEYFLTKRNDPKKNKNWISILFQYPALRAALLTAFIMLLLYVLLEMRRKQRIIPVMNKPVNDSLDFLKTIGRLYYDKKDHRNLSRKMASYFLEHVRNRYKLATNTLDEEFIKALFFKSGYDEKKLREIISFIEFIDTTPAISDSQLTDFYKHLESFYKTT